MHKCFLCEDEFENAISHKLMMLKGKQKGETMSVKKISDNGRVLEVCPKCMRAMLYGIAVYNGCYKVYDVNPTYMED